MMLLAVAIFCHNCNILTSDIKHNIKKIAYEY